MAVAEVSVLSHITNSALVVYLIQWLKGTARYQRFARWMPIAEGKVHVLMSALGAIGAGFGMHKTITGNWLDGWNVAFAIPPLWVMAHAAWDWSQQLALNQIVFAIAVQQKAAAPVVTVPVAKDVTLTAPMEKP